MDFTGFIRNVFTDWNTGETQISFSVTEKSALAELEKLKDKKLSIKVVQHREKRSLDANAMLWACIGDIAKSMTPPADKWEIYLQMLKRYGKYTYICVKPNVVDAMKTQWRECEIVGDIKINGKDAVQMLCYFGSSTYDSKEFSVLLEGVISEMVEIGLQPPPSKEMRMALAEWERKHEKAI